MELVAGEFCKTALWSPFTSKKFAIYIIAYNDNKILNKFVTSHLIRIRMAISLELSGVQNRIRISIKNQNVWNKNHYSSFVWSIFIIKMYVRIRSQRNFSFLYDYFLVSFCFFDLLYKKFFFICFVFFLSVCVVTLLQKKRGREK